MRVISSSQKARKERVISKMRQLHGLLVSKHDITQLDSISDTGTYLGTDPSGNRIVRVKFMGVDIFGIFMPCGWIHDIMAADVAEKRHLAKDCKDRRATMMTVENSHPVYTEFGFWPKRFMDLRFCMEMTPALAKSYARQMELSGMPVTRTQGTDSPKCCTGTKKAIISVVGKCCRCGATENLTYDHIVPRWMGGMTNLANGQVLCYECNQDKRGTFADYRINIWPQQDIFISLFIGRLWQGN